MGSDIVTQPQWRRTPDGDVILRPIEQWKAGLTEHGDIAICFATSQGTDPASAPGEPGQAQFICTQEDARARLEFISSDLMRGRDTPSPELNIVASYLVSNYRAMGFQPGGEGGTFYQWYPYPLRRLSAFSC